jgi:hypothetical protein
MILAFKWSHREFFRAPIRLTIPLTVSTVNKIKQFRRRALGASQVRTFIDIAYKYSC